MKKALLLCFIAFSFLTPKNFLNAQANAKRNILQQFHVYPKRDMGFDAYQVTFSILLPDGVRGDVCAVVAGFKKGLEDITAPTQDKILNSCSGQRIDYLFRSYDNHPEGNLIIAFTSTLDPNKYYIKYGFEGDWRQSTGPSYGVEQCIYVKLAAKCANYPNYFSKFQCYLMRYEE